MSPLTPFEIGDAVASLTALVPQFAKWASLSRTQRRALAMHLMKIALRVAIDVLD